MVILINFEQKHSWIIFHLESLQNIYSDINNFKHCFFFIVNEMIYKFQPLFLEI